MNKIIIEVIVPALSDTFEMRIPPTIQLYKTLELIKKAVTEMSDGRYLPSDETTVCDFYTGGILNLSLTPVELEIKNGYKILLI